MSLPTSRDVTLSAASQVPSSLLDRLQDQVVGRKQPSFTQWVAPGFCAVPNATGSSTVAGDRITGNAAWTFTGMHVGPHTDGDRITALVVKFLGTGAAQVMTLLLKLSSAAGAVTTLATLTITNPPATWANYTQPLVTPHVMAPGESISLDLTSGTLLNTAIGAVGITKDRL